MTARVAPEELSQSTTTTKTAAKATVVVDQTGTTTATAAVASDAFAKDDQTRKGDNGNDVGDGGAVEEEFRDDLPPVDWAATRDVDVIGISGESVRFSTLIQNGRTVVVFLRRFGCQTCLSYIVLFAHLKPILETSNTRVVFITCHRDLSEVHVFLRSFAYWLRSLNNNSNNNNNNNRNSKSPNAVVTAANDGFEVYAPNQSPGGGALPGELYMDADRTVYRAFGFLGKQVKKMQLARIYLFFKYISWFKMDRMTPAAPWIRNRKYVMSMALKAMVTRYLPKVSRDERRSGSLNQAPGIVVIENEKLLYRNKIMNNKDPAFARALVCDRPETELLDEVVTKGLEKFARVIGDSARFGKVDSHELPMIKKLGQGRESEVFKSRWMGAFVAVKNFRYVDSGGGGGDDDSEDPVQSFANEAAILMSLRHPNIITMVGFGCRPPEQYFLITEFMANGSLFDIIGDKDVAMGRERRQKFLVDTAKGMRFLHECRPQIIHQDLKSLNLLVDNKWNVKVSDFGIAKAAREPASGARGSGSGGADGGGDDDEGLMHGGTLQWMPPEHLSGPDVASTTKMDVFAFGVIMWEVALRRRPWRGVPMRVICRSVVNGERLPIPGAGAWERGFQRLVERCWHQNPKERPEFRVIERMLERGGIEVPAMD